jgi:hypothetical protein
MDSGQWTVGNGQWAVDSGQVPLKRMASSQNFFVWFCGVLICQRGLIPTEQHSKTNISPNSKKNSKIFHGVNSGTIWGRFMEKTRGQKSRATVPLNNNLSAQAGSTEQELLWLEPPGQQDSEYVLCMPVNEIHSNAKGLAPPFLRSGQG